MKRLRRLLLLLLIFALLLSACKRDVRCEGILQIYFLDVGQGDSVLFRTDGGDILLDAGPESHQDLLCLRLQELGVRELALMILSHPDEDHIGGADGVLARFPAKEVWLSGAPMENESAKRLLSVMKEMEIPTRVVRAHDAQTVGGVDFRVLMPFGNQNAEAGNESSIVLMVDYGETEIMLTGDVGVSEERDLLNYYSVAHLDCEIYKVGHHGSNTSTCIEFLKAMSPQYAVISCGADNSYGHPMGEILARLDDQGVTTLRTDLSGEILFETDGQSVWCPAD
jgi:competence protein ComEC